MNATGTRLARGDVVMSGGRFGVVWTVPSDLSVGILPIEVDPDTRRRNDVGVTDWADMAVMGLGVCWLAIRPSCPRVVPASRQVKVGVLSAEMLATVEWAVHREINDRAVERRWANWSPREIPYAPMMAN